MQSFLYALFVYVLFVYVLFICAAKWLSLVRKLYTRKRVGVGDNFRGKVIVNYTHLLRVPGYADVSGRQRGHEAGVVC